MLANGAAFTELWLLSGPLLLHWGTEPICAAKISTPISTGWATWRGAVLAAALAWLATIRRVAFGGTRKDLKGASVKFALAATAQRDDAGLGHLACFPGVVHEVPELLAVLHRWRVVEVHDGVFGCVTEETGSFQFCGAVAGAHILKVGFGSLVDPDQASSILIHFFWCVFIA